MTRGMPKSWRLQMIKQAHAKVASQKSERNLTEEEITCIIDDEYVDVKQERIKIKPLKFKERT